LKKKMQELAAAQPKSQDEQLLIAMKFKVEEAKKEDEIFMKKGVEQDDCEEAIHYYIKNDPEFKAKMTKAVQELQKKLVAR